MDNVTSDEKASSAVKPKCGIIMPISDTDGYPAGHWAEVLSILKTAIKDDFDSELVSNANEVAFIHKTIVHNIHDNDMVICDVSSRNANVMFELGMRLTWDKPTVIVIDSETPFQFDTSPIEHIVYPADLRHAAIEKFISDVKRKVIATHQKSLTDKNYSPFLGHFQRVRAKSLDTQELPGGEFILTKLEELSNEIRGIRDSSPFGRMVTAADLSQSQVWSSSRPGTSIGVRLRRKPTPIEVKEIGRTVVQYSPSKPAGWRKASQLGHDLIEFDFDGFAPTGESAAEFARFVNRTEKEVVSKRPKPLPEIALVQEKSGDA